jgi:hypothetical protein
VRRLIADSLQELEDHEAVKAFRARPGRTAALAEVKKRLGLDRPARRRDALQGDERAWRYRGRARRA